MKKIFIVVFLFTSLLVNAQKDYGKSMHMRKAPHTITSILGGAFIWYLLYRYTSKEK